MANTHAEALAQAFVKQTEALVQKNIIEFAFRAVLATGMTADELEELVDDVLFNLKEEPSHNVEAAGTSLFPSAASMKAAPPIPDVPNTKITELETKLHALENEVKGKPKDPIPDSFKSVNGTGVIWATPPPTWNKLPAKKYRGMEDTPTPLSRDHGRTAGRGRVGSAWDSDMRNAGSWSPPGASKSQLEPKDDGNNRGGWAGEWECRTPRNDGWY